MKVFYDHLCFWQKYGGVPRYFVEIMKRIPPELYILGVDVSNNEYLKDLHCKYNYFLPNIIFRGKPRVEAEIGKLFNIPRMMSGKFDIYHQTHYDMYAYRYLSKTKKKVTTIHDLNYFVEGKFYQGNIGYARSMRQQERSILESDHIITVSMKTKEDLCKLFHVSEEKITTIYHGVDKNIFSCKEDVEDFQQKDQFVLFVGRRNMQKNFKNLCFAFKNISARYSQLKMYCVGQAFTKVELEMLKSLGLSEKVLSFAVDDKRLASFYRKALLFIFPSFYEGFGMPILEAMSCNCPVLLSNASCFPEIAGDAGCYFDPYSTDDMTEKMEYVIEHPTYRNELIQKGMERVKDFSWERCAEEHLKVYQSLL